MVIYALVCLGLVSLHGATATAHHLARHRDDDGHELMSRNVHAAVASVWLLFAIIAISIFLYRELEFS